MKALIDSVRAREILDSRGTPTLEVEVESAGRVARAAVPSGASTGRHEALELRDNDPSRYGGKGVLTAASHVEGEIAHGLSGHDAFDQTGVDALLCELDGTPTKSRLGANALVGTSMAVCRLAAAAAGEPLYRYLGGAMVQTLPVPLLNVVNGGRHADSGLAIQEFMLVPVGAHTFHDALRWCVETYQTLKKLLAERGLSTAVGDEGGFAPHLGSEEEALELLVTAIERAGRRPGEEIALALDSAASEFGGPDKGYTLSTGSIDQAGLIDLYQTWARRYPLVSIEDGVAEDDMVGWQNLTQRLGRGLQLVGDDVFVTQKARLEAGIRSGVANAILLKLNQVGTVSETVETARIARQAGYRLIVSHRSGETEDPFIADFAVALGADQIKTGAPARSERLAKYNRLLGIERQSKELRFDGRAAIAQHGLS